MRTPLLIAGLSIAVLLIAAVILFLFPGSREGSPTEEPEVTFPGSGEQGPGASDRVVMDVPRRDGTTATVRDFRLDSTTVADVQNPGVYYLAGSPEYCLLDETCPEAAAVAGVNIIYNEADGSFTIALLEEPLSEARVRAQQFLLLSLGIPEAELCTLNYYVGTDRALSENFAGRNLGFSLCPGATVLP